MQIFKVNYLHLLLVASATLLLASSIRLVRSEDDTSSQAALKSDAKLKHMMQEVSSPNYSVLQILVDRSKPNGFKTPADLDKAAAYALSSECSGTEHSCCLPSSRRSFNKLYKEHILEKCATILPIFNIYEVRLDRIVHQPGVHEESRLQAMGVYCRDLARKLRRSAVFKQFLALSKSKQAVSTGKGFGGFLDIFRRGSKDNESSGANSAYELVREPEQVNHQNNGLVETHNNNDDDDGSISVEPSEFATSKTHETHDPNIDYGREDEMIVGPRKQ